MPPSPRKGVPATAKVAEVLRANLTMIELRLAMKDAHTFPDITKLMEQRFRFVCELETVKMALDVKNTKDSETEALQRRISDLENQLSLYKAKYGDVFGADSMDALSLDDPKP